MSAENISVTHTVLFRARRCSLLVRNSRCRYGLWSCEASTPHSRCPLVGFPAFAPLVVAPLVAVLGKHGGSRSSRAPSCHICCRRFRWGQLPTLPTQTHRHLLVRTLLRSMLFYNVTSTVPRFGLST